MPLASARGGVSLAFSLREFRRSMEAQCPWLRVRKCLRLQETGAWQRGRRQRGGAAVPAQQRVAKASSAAASPANGDEPAQFSSRVPVPGSSQQQQLFAVLYTYVEDIVSKRGPHRAAHLALWSQAPSLLGGALGDPPSHALILLHSPSAQHIEEHLVKRDPYLAHGLVTDYRILPWTLAVGTLQPQAQQQQRQRDDP